MPSENRTPIVLAPGSGRTYPLKRNYLDICQQLVNNRNLFMSI